MREICVDIGKVHTGVGGAGGMKASRCPALSEGSVFCWPYLDVLASVGRFAP
jgi:hypothetical protein